MPGGVALAALAVLARGDRGSLGPIFVPEQGWLHWARITLLLGLIVVLFVAVALVVVRLGGMDLEMRPLPPELFWAWTRPACIDAPLVAVRCRR